MKFSQFLLFIAFLVAMSTSHAQSPGGVSSNLKWWLKSNTGVFTNAGKTTNALNNDLVHVWADQSGIANDATQATGTLKPTFSTNVINGYPVIFFDNTNNHYLDGTTAPGIGPTESLNVVMVYQLMSCLADGGIGDGNGTFIFDRPTATNNLMSFKITSTNKYRYQRREDGGSNLEGPETVSTVDVNNFVNVGFYRTYAPGASNEGVFVNGKLDVSQTVNTGNITAPIVRIGRHATDAGHGMNGYFAEIIIHNRALSATERQQINSYIGIKYGLAMDQSTVTNYLRSDGTVIYPATTASYTPYISDIAGVGRDDGSALTQTSSKSQNANSVVRMTIESPGTTLANNEFLVWGDNNGNLTTPNSTDVDGTTVKRRLSRVWRASETGGDVGNTTISFDLTGIPGTLTATDIKLMVNASSTFASGTSTYSGTLAGRIFTVTGVNLANGNFFTIGTVNPTSTPLPVSLVDFKVHYESPVVVASWKTATELNNDHFTLERSGPNLSFQDIVHIRGAGTSTTLLSYQATDDGPIAGLSYYRLKQTDHDGTSEYSSVKSIYIPYGEHAITISPNPSSGKQFLINVPDPSAKLDYVEILSQTGDMLRKETPESKTGNSYSMSFEKPLAAGLYLLRIRYSDRLYYAKVIVQ
ncbi:MAG: T9SS type A sorting domain-containing protein [Chryseolinea sp.]